LKLFFGKDENWIKPKLVLEIYPVPILKTLIPHFGQVPFIAGRPFFILISSGSLISLFALHFTQYAVTIITNHYMVLVKKGMNWIGRQASWNLNYFFGKNENWIKLAEFLRPKMQATPWTHSVLVWKV